MSSDDNHHPGLPDVSNEFCSHPEDEQHHESSDQPIAGRKIRNSASMANYVSHGTAGRAEIVHTMLQRLPAAQVTRQVNRLLKIIKNNEFRKQFIQIMSAHARALRAYAKAHPWKLSFMIMGIIFGTGLVINPLAMAGFGAMGPVAGSFAAAWQATIGNVATGSLFAALQSIGMVHAVTIPLVGLGILGVSGGAMLKVTGAAAWVNERVGKKVKLWWNKIGKKKEDW